MENRTVIKRLKYIQQMYAKLGHIPPLTVAEKNELYDALDIAISNMKIRDNLEIMEREYKRFTDEEWDVFMKMYLSFFRHIDRTTPEGERIDYILHCVYSKIKHALSNRR